MVHEPGKLQRTGLLSDAAARPIQLLHKMN
jgi:hypothetical protein